MEFRAAFPSDGEAFEVVEQISLAVEAGRTASRSASAVTLAPVTAEPGDHFVPHPPPPLHRVDADSQVTSLSHLGP